jgi:hypothetical protein
MARGFAAMKTPAEAARELMRSIVILYLARDEANIVLDVLDAAVDQNKTRALTADPTIAAGILKDAAKIDAVADKIRADAARSGKT